MTIKESIKKIVDKKFDSVINGYSPSAVDSFLDIIINDLETIEKQNEIIKNENEELKEEKKELWEKNQNLEQTIHELKMEINAKENEIKKIKVVNEDKIDEIS